MKEKPNFLFIMCDQMRYDALGCNGNTFINTPNIGRLAARGTNFSNAFTPDPICVPARACLTTGCYPVKCTGVKNNGGVIKGGFPLMAEEFNKRGYETFAIGKLHYLPYETSEIVRTTNGFRTVELAESGRIVKNCGREGAEEYLTYLKSVGWGGYSRANGLGNNDVFAAASMIPAEYFVDAWVADRTLHHLDRHLKKNPDSPFFIFASFPKPHSAYDPPRPFDQLYDPRSLPGPVGDISMLKERGLGQFYSRHFEYEWDTLSPEAKKTIKAYYYGLVSFQDAQIGRLLDDLRARGLEENTVVVYTADHGDMLGDFGLYFKEIFYNGSVRIPMMISLPGTIPGGVKTDSPAGLQDLLPTLLAMTGEPLQAEVDGRSLLPAIFEGRDVRKYYVSQCHDHPKQQYMVADREWKYIYHQDGGIEELYNMREDPCELVNLADGRGGKSGITGPMRDYLIDWCREIGDLTMLEGGGLAAGPQRQYFKRNSPDVKLFGRRYY